MSPEGSFEEDSKAYSDWEMRNKSSPVRTKRWWCEVNKKNRDVYRACTAGFLFDRFDINSTFPRIGDNQ